MDKGMRGEIDKGMRREIDKGIRGEIDKGMRGEKDKEKIKYQQTSGTTAEHEKGSCSSIV